MKKQLQTLKVIGSSKLSDADRQMLDFYQTPAYATRTLLEHFDLKAPLVWEPMAGNGMIAKELQKGGKSVWCSDIVQQKFKLNAVEDFFDINSFTATDDFAIVTNPPYKLANDFLLHALADIKPKTCCVFIPIRYLEGKKRWDEIFSKYKPSKVLTYVNRLGCFTSEDEEKGIVTDRGVGSAVAYMWLCFDSSTMQDKDSITELEWIS